MAVLDDVAVALRAMGREPEAAHDGLRFPLSGLDPDEAAPSRWCEVQAFELTEDAGLLTFKTGYEFAFPADVLIEARAGAHEITEWMPLGGMQVEDDGSAHFRYSLPLGKGATLLEGQLETTVSLLDFCQLHFGDYLLRLADGRVSLFDLPELIAGAEGFAAEHGLA